MKRAFLSVLVGISANIFGQISLIGPDGPQMIINNSGSQLNITLSNPLTSNNYLQLYEELISDNSYLSPGYTDSTLNFQGYMIYQFLDTSITWQDKDDTNKVRLVWQCDIVDLIDTCANSELDSLNNCNSIIKVNGHNTGITNTFTLNQNPFTQQPYQLGDNPCFYGTAYAHNPFMINPNCSNEPLEFFLGPRATKTCFGELFNVENLTTIEFHPFPNPANISFQINGDFENAQMELMNLQGQMIINKFINNGDKISVDVLSNGIYLVKLIDGLHTSYQRLIVSH